MNKDFDTKEKWVISLVGFSHMISHSLMLIFPTILLSLQSEYQVSLFTLGKIQTIAFFLYGIGAIPAGFMADWLGSRNLLLVCLAGSGISGIFTGLTHSLSLFSTGLFLMGLFGSFYHPSGLSLISRTVRKRSQALGFHGIAGSLGLALSPVITGFIASVANWRYAYFFFGMISLIIAAGVRIFLKTNLTLQMEKNVEQERYNRWLPLVLFLASFVLIGLSYRGFMTFFPAHFSRQSAGILGSMDSVFKGGLLTTLMLLAGIPGQYLGGKLGDRYPREVLMLIIIGLNVPLLFSISYFSNYALLSTALIFGLIHFSFQPVGNGILASYTNSARRSLGYGIQFFLSFGLGSFSASLSGYIAEKWGIYMVFSVMGFILVPVIIISIILIYLRGKQESEIL